MAIFVGNALTAHAQGGCFVCHRGDNLVDTEVQVEGEGILALCSSCIQDAAQAAGLTLNEGAFAEIRATLERERAAYGVEAVVSLTADLAFTERALETAESTIATLQDALDRIGSKPPARKGTAPKRQTTKADAS
jgi:hypothetical protein